MNVVSSAGSDFPGQMMSTMTIATATRMAR